VHHVRFRSRGGVDSTANCACLCRMCHAEIHAYRLAVSGDANGKLKFERLT
jgi:5-methylcytosine-specific restriction endonuclease McrA